MRSLNCAAVLGSFARLVAEFFGVLRRSARAGSEEETARLPALAGRERGRTWRAARRAGSEEEGARGGSLTSIKREQFGEVFRVARRT